MAKIQLLFEIKLPLSTSHTLDYVKFQDKVIFFQHVPLILLISNEASKNLKTPMTLPYLCNNQNEEKGEKIVGIPSRTKVCKYMGSPEFAIFGSR